MNQARRQHRHNRLRHRVQGTAARPRVSVFRSATNLDVQFIDDLAGRTLVTVKVKPVAKQTKMEQAQVVGEMAAQAAKEAGINQVVFDRGGYAYHGRIKTLAEALRAGGLEF